MAWNFRNYPPEHGVRVPAQALLDLTENLLRASGMDHPGAALVATKLVDCDLRCVFSHGTKALSDYVPRLRDGRVNPTPKVRVEREGGATAVVDGDGGLGYHACNTGMALAVARARQFGVGAVATYHHHHIGAAGLWTRIALKEDCIGMAFSGHRFEPPHGAMITEAAKSSPVSVAVPAGKQPPLVLDMGARFLAPTLELLEEHPQVFLKSLGLGAASLALGGLLSGVWRTEAQPPASPWEAGQGSLLVAWDVARFTALDAFKAEMDRYIGNARSLRPLPAFDRAELAGGMEWAWEQENARKGVPIGQEHLDLLSGLAEEVGVAAPWNEFEDNRF